MLLETPDLIAVGALGDDVRRRLHGTRTTFVRVFEMHVDALPAVAAARGRRQARCGSSGTPRRWMLAVAAVRAAAALAGAMPVTGFSLADLLALGAARSTSSLLRGSATPGLEAWPRSPIDLLADAAAAVEAARDGPGSGAAAHRPRGSRTSGSRWRS